MKKMLIFICTLFINNLFAIPAPYLISLEVTTNNFISISWRNNSIDTKGFILIRKASDETIYKFIDSIPIPNENYIDSTVILSTKYYYGLFAYSETEVSDTSNIDTITTPEGVIQTPGIGIYWEEDKRQMKIDFTDNSSIEKGFRIFRTENFSSFNMIKDTISEFPNEMGQTISCYDKSNKTNTWYSYYIEVFNDSISLQSYKDSTFTFDLLTLVETPSKQVKLGNEISTFPIKYKSWCMKVDTLILLNETNAPESSYTIINVSNTTNPYFVKYQKSFVALFDINNFTNNTHIVGTPNNIDTNNTDIQKRSLYYYNFNGDNFSLVDTITHPTSGKWGPYLEKIMINDDSTFLAEYHGKSGDHNYYNSLFSITDTSLDEIYENKIGEWYFLPPGNQFLYRRKYFCSLWKSNEPYLGIIDCNYLEAKWTWYPHSPPNFSKIPRTLYGLALTEQELVFAKEVFLDTLSKIAYIISDSTLKICEYSEVAVSIFENLTNNYPLSEKMLKILPNPFTNSTIIYLPNHKNQIDISIYDIQGRLMHRVSNFKGNRFIWNSYSFPNGIYFLRVKIEDKIYKSKLIKTR